MFGKLRDLFGDNLFRNSFYLMLTTGTMAALGFVFWLICAHLFRPDQIGVATSLISAMSLISYASALGFNTTFVRVLPTSENRNNEINTGLVLVICAAALIATAYIFTIPYLTPALGIIHENALYALGFVMMVALAAINLLTDSIFIAYRAAKYNLLIDGWIMGGAKVLLPLVFVGLGAYGIFTSAGVAAAIGMVASIIFLAHKFGYRPKVRIHLQTLKDVFHYSFKNYVVNLLNLAPTLVLPLIIISRLGPSATAYYYLAFMMANLLYAVTYSVSQSFFAEGSYGEVALKKLVGRSVLILGAITVPAGIVLAVFGPWVLQIFGKSYSEGGANVIIILALAAPAIVAYSLGSAILRIQHKLRSLIIVSIVYLLATSGLAILWASRGLAWVAGAWLVGNLIAGTISSFLIFRSHRRFLTSQLATHKT